MSVWYGPEVKVPKHPTPWRTDSNRVYDANGVLVITIEGRSTFANQDIELAQILRDAVNAKALTPVEVPDLPKFYRKKKGERSLLGGTVSPGPLIASVHSYHYYRQVPGQELERLATRHDRWIQAAWPSVEAMREEESRTVEEIDHDHLPGLAPNTPPFKD
jgi:hypothetical protein